MAKQFQFETVKDFIDNFNIRAEANRFNTLLSNLNNRLTYKELING